MYHEGKWCVVRILCGSSSSGVGHSSSMGKNEIDPAEVTSWGAECRRWDRGHPVEKSHEKFRVLSSPLITELHCTNIVSRIYTTGFLALLFGGF